MTDKAFSPREFLKKRRPERFSDSVIVKESGLKRSNLEYHLDVLTNKKQETQFEDFARALAQREICPNLIPQTGPTGGGDSKVDSETYPVADTLSMGWYVGIGREAARERWAFAFSAKKKWRPKLKSDIANLAGTNRGYTTAFFVTSQYVRDKDRASIEDSLSEEYVLDVRVLDRTWILDRVFANGHEDLAIKHLELGNICEVRSKGPLDVERGMHLSEVERRIAEALEKREHTPAVVNAAIEALELSRELEEPELLIHGRMDRAIRMADEYGTPHQRITARYQAAWTSFWWFEDARAMARLYGEIERALTGTINPHELELLSNLWLLLHGCVARGDLEIVEADLVGRESRLRAELDRLASDSNRRSASLQARTLALQIELASTVNEAGRERIVTGLTEVVDESRGLVSYPLQPLVSMLLEVSEVLEGVSGFDDLFDKLVTTSAERKGEVEAARILLARGAKQLDLDRPLEAIMSIGKALTRLYKHESRHDLVRALFLAGVAYQRAGLLWAARGSLITAASVATAEYWTYGDITNAQLACYEKLRWLELELGRLPQLLCWHELTSTCAAALTLSGDSLPGMAERNVRFDAILGILFLKLDLWSLSKIERLPETLYSLGLVNAAVALQWALGEEHLPGEFVASLDEEQAPVSYFERWLIQPAAKILPDSVELGSARRVTLESWILGCNVVVDSETAAPCLELSESFLAALEALLATGPIHRAVAREPRLAVSVRRSEFADRPFSFRVTEELGRPHVVIATIPFNPANQPTEQQNKIKNRLFELLAAVMARIVMVDDLEAWLEQIFGDEDAVARAINFTSSMVTVSNVLGGEPRLNIGSWQEPSASTYRLTRDQIWKTAPDVEAEGGTFPRLAEGQPPDDLFDPGRMNHRRMRTFSLIREQLWEEAGWSGTMFMWVLKDDSPPVLAPLFKNPRAAADIFLGWREDLGPKDEDSRLRVSIIRGIDRREPAAYRVSIGSDPFAQMGRGDRASIAIAVVRFNTMQPSTLANLDGFLERYAAVGQYLLAPAAIFPDRAEPIIAYGLGVLKQDLVVRQAWQISLYDLDAAAIRADDDPIIPDNGKEAPVAGLLEARRQAGA